MSEMLPKTTEYQEDSLMSEDDDIAKRIYKKIYPIDLVFDFSTITEEYPMTPCNTEASTFDCNGLAKDRHSLASLVTNG